MNIYAAVSIIAVLQATILLPDAAEKPTSPRDFSWIHQRIQELQPTAKEKRIDEIGWAKDIRTAKQLARENNRPVFLFTHDGRINIGRC